jgi:hypothetical protein
MDFSFSPEEQAFRQEVSDFLDKEAPQEWQKKKVSFFDMPSTGIYRKNLAPGVGCPCIGLKNTADRG